MSSLSFVTPNPLISLHTEQSACLFIRPAVSPHTLLHMIRRHSASHHFLSLRIPLYFPRTRYRILREKRKKDALSVILLPEARRIRPSSRNKHSRIRHPASKRKGLENLRKNKQPKENHVDTTEKTAGRIYPKSPPPKKTRHKVNSLWILPRLGQTGQSFPIETSAALKTKILPSVCQVPALYAETSLLIRKTVFRACGQPAASECHSSGMRPTCRVRVSYIF